MSFGYETSPRESFVSRYFLPGNFDAVENDGICVVLSSD